MSWRDRSSKRRGKRRSHRKRRGGSLW